MGEIGFVVLVLAVVALPVWLSRGMRKTIKERMAPVPARSTAVVVDTPAPEVRPLPSLLSQVVIRTGNGGGKHHLRAQASGCGLNDYVQDTDEAGHGHGGHGHGDGL